jgi:hypothetical protein
LELDVIATSRAPVAAVFWRASGKYGKVVNLVVSGRTEP